MRRALKIIGWTIGGLLLTLVAVVCIAVYVVFTPARLTPIAREAAGKFITCQYEIGEVDLTFFSTFPRFGLRADGLLLVNPMTGAQNDTVVEARHVVATVDVQEFLTNKNLYVHELALEGASVNFFINAGGENNLAVFVSSPDTTEEDTTAFSLPFKELKVDGLHLEARAITFVDVKDTINASLGATELSAKAESWDDMLVALDAHDVCAKLKGETYADRLHVELIAPMAMNLETMHFAFDGARLAVNDFGLRVEGEVTLGDEIDVDARLTTDKWQIEPLLAIVPKQFTRAIEDMNLKGAIALDASAKGKVGEKKLPVVTLHNVHADLWRSHVDVKGIISDMATDMLIDGKVALDAYLPDFRMFLPKQMHLTGRAQGTAETKIRLSDLSAMNLHKGKTSADLTLADIHYHMDSMEAVLPRTYARVHIPNSVPSRPKVDWVRLDLQTDKVDFSMATPLTAKLQQSTVSLEAGNVLSDDPVLYAAVDLRSNHPLEVQMDSMGGVVDAPKLYAYAEYNTKDTTVMPVVKATLDCQALDGFFKDISGQLQATQLEAAISGGRKDKSAPRLKAKINTQALQAKVGNELAATTGTLALEAAARYNAKGKNVLLQWNPRLKVDLKNGELNMPDRIPEPVVIPSIEFNYSNREMNIDNSRIELGQSDLSLKGYVRNIGKWFRHDTILEGVLEIESEHCDANQLLMWFSDDSGSEETEIVESQKSKVESTDSVSGGEEKKEIEPFLVPTDVNLALNTHMREVEIFNQVAKNLKGGIYVNDGTLVLDEVGFVCRAAKLQLTAMYRTPRRNHLYMGLDYHMLDVDLDELTSIIPDLESMMPMLSSFKGAAEFHLAAETYLNSQYKPKMSTLRGAASLTGKDLVVLDGETFSEISRLLMFNKKTENKIDSINAEITIYKNEIDVYPLCVQMDNYMVALGGRHNTNMTFDYDINVLSPIYLGVNVSGSMDNLSIKLAKCKFAQDFRPHWYQKADTQSLELRQRIKQSMEKNVRIK